MRVEQAQHPCQALTFVSDSCMMVYELIVFQLELEMASRMEGI